jgi:hypothetical protein
MPRRGRGAAPAREVRGRKMRRGRGAAPPGASRCSARNLAARFYPPFRPVPPRGAYSALVPGGTPHRFRRSPSAANPMDVPSLRGMRVGGKPGGRPVGSVQLPIGGANLIRPRQPSLRVISPSMGASAAKRWAQAHHLEPAGLAQAAKCRIGPSRGDGAERSAQRACERSRRLAPGGAAPLPRRGLRNYH